LDSALLECLQAVPVQELITKLINPFVEPTFQWYPVVDDYSSHPFLPKSPLAAMQSGDFNQIPFMSGTNKDEGALTYLSDLNKLKHGGGPPALDGCELAGPARLSITHGSKHPQTFSPITVADLEKVESIKTFYTGGGAQFFEKYAWPAKQAIIDMYTDSQFISPEQESLSLMSAWSAPIFNYRLTYKAKNSPILNIIGANDMPIGVFHGDDLLYFFSSPVNPLVNEDERKLAKEMLTFWSNFAKSGSPGASWKPFTTEQKNYMDLKPTPELKQDIVAERMAQWRDVVWEEREAMVGEEVEAVPSPLCS